MPEGLILKGVGGFYYVETAGHVSVCRARGIFRKEGLTPVPGDYAVISEEPDGTGTVEEILPRRNLLARPPIANIDQLVIVVSVCEPVPNALVLDQTIAAAEDRGIEPVLVFSKIDLHDAAPYFEIYRKAGFPVFCISSQSGEGVDAVEAALKGKIIAFTGNSGVGKSSLLNRMFSQFHLETGEISHKLGRGRHTTRQVELLKLESGRYVADTPGFSSVDMENCASITKDNLPYCFREFVPFLGGCKFVSCSHTCEKGCAVLEAVRSGEISRSRHESYTVMYREIDSRKEWSKK